MRKSISCLFLSIIILLAMLAAGCGQAPNLGPKETAGKSYTITDAQGNRVELKGKPKNIVSMSVSTDEIIVKLVEPERIKALSVLADDPGICNVTKEAKAIPNRVTATSGEAILAMGADLVIIPDWYKAEQIQTFKELGLPVYVYVTPHTMAGIEECILELGKVVGEDSRAQELVQAMEKRLKAIKDKIGVVPEGKKKTALFARTTGFYYSKKAIFSDYLRLAQGIDAMTTIDRKNVGYLGQETIIKLNPDVFLLSDWHSKGYRSPQKVEEDLYNNPAYATVTAVRNKSIYRLSGKYLQGLSSYSVEAVEEVAKALYPERFK